LIAENESTFVNFYKVELKTKESNAHVKLLKSVESRGINHVEWSPQGRFSCLASLDSLSGTLLFYDTEDFTLLGTGEHYKCSKVCWDPTGRFLLSGFCSAKPSGDTGFNIWSATGNLLSQHSQTNLENVFWRPRPPSLLSKADQKKIKKNLKEYSINFDKLDIVSVNTLVGDLSEKRKLLWAEYCDFMSKFYKEGRDYDTTDYIDQVVYEIREIV
jgi:translation initiation factor 3 subunit B